MQRTIVFVLTFLSAALILSGCSRDYSSDGSAGDGLAGKLDPAEVAKTGTMKVFAHYMPWFESPESSGNNAWGQHWTMATCNPDLTDSEGRRQIASHYYPLIGPYASNDPAVLNYHCLLMKYSGIDGVMIDWYGTRDRYDYPENLRNTEALVKATERVGLKFAIVYEDQTVKELSGNAEKEAQVLRDMRYLVSNFFNLENYVKIDGKPLLMVFGPQGVTAPSSWSNIFAQMSEKPLFIVLNSHSGAVNNSGNRNSEGEFVWVNPDPDYAALTTGHQYYIAGAMPGFEDYYMEGGWGDGYTSYPHEDGALFERQLQAAKDSGLEYLQISTWNDFGEGTTIEPSVEYGYRYLSILQDFNGVSYDTEDLELIHRWYELKARHAGSQGEVSKYLSQAFYHLIALQPAKARELIEKAGNL